MSILRLRLTDSYSKCHGNNGAKVGGSKTFRC
jgi:hypothetical protein